MLESGWYVLQSETLVVKGLLVLHGCFERGQQCLELLDSSWEAWVWVVCVSFCEL